MSNFQRGYKKPHWLVTRRVSTENGELNKIMCTNAIQAPVKYRKPLAEVVLALSVFLDITALFNDYEI